MKRERERKEKRPIQLEIEEKEIFKMNENKKKHMCFDEARDLIIKERKRVRDHLN